MSTSSAKARGALPFPWARWSFRIALFISSFGLVQLGASQTTGGGSALRQGIWLLLGLCALPGLRQSEGRPRLSWMRDRGMPVLALFLLYCLVSSLWSAVALISFKRALLLALVIWIGYAAVGVAEGEGDDFSWLCAGPVFCLLGLSFGVVLLDPGVGITPIGWRGATSHKNEFGQVCALALLCLTALIGQLRMRYWLPLALAAMLGMALSRSASCQMAVLIALTVQGVAWIYRWTCARRAAQPWVLGGLLLLLALAYVPLAAGMLPLNDSLPDDLLALMGKSSNLTGRTQLWTLVLDNSRYHNPWLGGGYGGFWNGIGSVAGYIAWAFPGGYVDQAHNSYIDLYNDLGYLGLVGLTLFFLAYWRNLLAPGVRASREFLFHLGFVVFILVLSNTESVLFRTTQLLNLMLMASFIRVAALARLHADRPPA
ncbi:O-antigen ligase family protein [Paludibacterium purpuratum]|uniref:O-antigen ligase family protein n=1 Tax=Paludibacterium purpuratum TaxID=1144873 RepID=UPI001414FDDC|nr:O-antigen ligase family protein [Paludibacterium purpuratum]